MAYAWFFVAAQREHLMAMNGRERLSRLLSHADLEAANRKTFDYAIKVPGRKETPATSPKEPAVVKKTKPIAPKEN